MRYQMNKDNAKALLEIYIRLKKKVLAALMAEDTGKKK